MKSFRLSKKLMGSKFELLLHHESEPEAIRLLDMAVAEIERLENLLSEFRADSITSEINRNAGIRAVDAGPEVFDLIKRSIHLSELCGGCFDINIGALKAIYKFKNSDFTFPAADVIADALSKTGYQGIDLNEDGYQVKLNRIGMSLSFAAIGKGYAADRVKAIWLENGVDSGLISASGDLCTIGKPAHQESWTVGIADPDNKEQTIMHIPLHESSIATSGDYEQYFVHEGKRYSHTIDPLSGYPLTGIKSVSVISPAAELSDALATAVSVMGVDEGLDFISQLPDTHCIIIDSDKQIHFSNQIQLSHAV